MTRLRLPLTLLLLVAALLLAWQGRLFQTPAAVINWTTESEVDTLGFHVYRATDPLGPYEQVSAALIPSKGDPFSGGGYTFSDPTVQANQLYFYQLEELESSGELTRLPDTVRYQSRREPNWIVVSALLAAVMLLWLLPGRSPRAPVAEPAP